MEPKDVVTLVVAIALVAVIGFLIIRMMQTFMGEGGLFQEFLSSIFTAIYERALGILD